MSAAINNEGCAALEQYLEDNEVEQKNFASTIERDPAFLNHLIHGRKRPSLGTAFRIEVATGGEVTARSWLDADEKKRIRAIEKRTA